MYEVNIDHDNCIGCGECVEVCPEEILVPTDFYPVLYDAEGCVGCKRCVEVCEQDSIYIKDVEESLKFFFR